MDDFEDINEQSFVAESDEENNENNRHRGSSRNVRDSGVAQEETLSQDFDFQSEAQVVVRPRVGAAQGNVPEPRPQNTETEESTCSICFESWTNSGSHRLVSIKCGHLFGESCILKWISQRGRDGAAKCPECNHPSKRKDIRRIWSKSVVVVDTAEREEAVSRAKKEQELRMRCEQDLAQSKMAYEMLKTEMMKLQKKHDRQRAFKIKYRSELDRLKLTNPQKDIAREFSYLSFKTVPFLTAPVGTANYMSYRQDEEMLVCSQQIYDKHGIVKVSMRDFSRSRHGIIPIHSQAIRDVQCYTNGQFANKSMVLTASMDKTLKVTSATSEQTVLTYDLKAPVWSCCWSNTNPFAMYCSTKAKQTSILTLDLRNTKSPVASFSQTSLLGYSPIHSMVHIAPLQSQRQEGILCGNLEGAFIYNFEAKTVSGVLSQESLITGSQGSSSGDHAMSNLDRDQERRIPFRVPGASCYSVSFDPASRCWMASFKFLEKQFTQHVKGYLDQDAVNGDLVLKSEFKVLGGPPVPSMSRTSVFSRQDGSTCMTAGSDSQTYVWYGAPESQPSIVSDTSSQPPSADGSLTRLTLQSSGAQTRQRSDLIKDVKPVVIGRNEYIVALSDNQLELYRWSEVQPEHSRSGGDLTEDSDSDSDDKSEDKDGRDDGEVRDKGKRRRMDEGAHRAVTTSEAGAVVIAVDGD
ncbi:hypothetical protein EDD21DRAFT_363410 [Dissophora ornata]|nr:hypothetical protein EDD21DRAFT_363410 [Dissophora ornata]